MQEDSKLFENRKKDHIRIALSNEAQAQGFSGLDRVTLVHEALPEINFAEISISKKIFNQELKAPLFISSMTAGFEGSVLINSRLARAAQSMGWAMGVGSQRKELFDPQAAVEWKQIRTEAPNAVLIGNLGLTQLIHTDLSDIQRLVDNLQASALFIHTNPLQEVLQPEGTPQFRGGLDAIEKLAKKLSVPIIVKEVGCGFSDATLTKLKNRGIYGVDLAGLGGTHWGRVEGLRSETGNTLFEAAETFKNWGHATVDCLKSSNELNLDYKLWASGGVRTGLDAAKLLAMNAEMVGLAMPLMQAALESEQSLLKLMTRLEYELKIAMFCTGCSNLDELAKRMVWTWK
jgi:isopentenyl-diphosphate delta-isomerase